MSTNQLKSVVVVGASAAGTATALNLRNAGYPGPITLLGEETVLPYDRPPLSKGMLLGTTSNEELGLATQEELTANHIELRLGVRATSLDVAGHLVHLADGGALPYDTLVVATGASSRKLPATAAFNNVYTLRTHEDATNLRAILRPGARLGIVGGGLIGLEVAATARALGLEVSVIEPAPVPLADRLTPTVASWLLQQHITEGVDLHIGVSVDTFVSHQGAVTALALTNGTEVEVDVVLVSIGAAPNTAWLDSSDITLSNGVVCDEFQRAAQDVYAVGDVANGFHPSLARHLRLENRSNASEGAAHLAKTLTGGTEPYTPVPFFWTDQYHHKVQGFGVVNPEAETEFVHGSVDEDRWIMTCRNNGRLSAVIAKDRGKGLLEWRRKLQNDFLQGPAHENSNDQLKVEASR